MGRLNAKSMGASRLWADFDKGQSAANASALIVQQRLFSSGRAQQYDIDPSTCSSLSNQSSSDPASGAVAP
jgi:hypothetical protein